MLSGDETTDIDEHQQSKRENLKKKKRNLIKQNKLNNERALNEIDDEIERISNDITILKQETNNADDKIKQYCGDFKLKVKDFKKTLQNNLKILVKQKFNELKSLQKKYNEIRNNIELNGYSNDIKKQIKSLKNSNNIDTNIYVFYDENLIKYMINCVKISDYKIKSNNDIDRLKNDNNTLRDKVKELSKQLSIEQNSRDAESYRNEITMLQDKIRSMQKHERMRRMSSINESDKDIEWYKNEVKQLRQTISDMSSKLSNHARTSTVVIKNDDSMIEAVKQKIKELDLQNNELKKKNKELQAQLKTLMDVSRRNSNKAPSVPLPLSPSDSGNVKSTSLATIDDSKTIIDHNFIELKENEIICNDLYRWKGDKISSLNFKKIPTKRYFIYSPQLKLLIYADNLIQYNDDYNDKKTMIYVKDIKINDKDLNTKLGQMWDKKYFKIEYISNKQKKIILLGCDDVEMCQIWVNKIRQSLQK